MYYKISLISFYFSWEEFSWRSWGKSFYINFLVNSYSTWE